jgi:hypothetical protein
MLLGFRRNIVALSHQDIIECKEIAREIVKEVLKEHIETCPHGRALLISKYLIIGMIIGTTIFSFAGSATAIVLLKHLIGV